MAVAQGTVLLIDDDPVFRGFLSAWLGQSGYRVRTAINGTEGLKEIQSELPDLVLCDLQMPGLDGLQVLRRLVKEHPHLPVIMVSGASRIADVIDALRIGAWDYQLKPINQLEQFQKSIQECMARAQVLEEHASESETASKSEPIRTSGALCADTVELHTNLMELSESPQFGRRVQRELLPVPQARFGPLHINRSWRPLGDISGDFLDYFPLDEDRLAFYVVDVSGHGPAAAFMIVLLKSLLNAPLRAYQRNQDPMLRHPEQVLAYLNHEICRLKLGHALNISYGIIDMAAEQAYLSSGALYPPPIFWLPSKGRWRSLVTAGMSLGVVDGLDYPLQEHEFSPGNQLLMCSDGVFTGEQREDPDRVNYLLDRLGSAPLVEEIWQAQLLEPVHDSPTDDVCALFLDWPEGR